MSQELILKSVFFYTLYHWAALFAKALPSYLENILRNEEKKNKNEDYTNRWYPLGAKSPRENLKEKNWKDLVMDKD